jgi:hypothetical protein
MRSPALITAHRHPAGFLEARARAGSGAHGEVLASFLESDVQGDLATARALLDEVAAAQRGVRSRPGVGNAYSVAIGPDGAVIRNAVLENALPERYSLADLRIALKTWISAIEDAR